MFLARLPTPRDLPKTHVDYWLPKLQRNQERDLETNVALTADGWMVLRFWEHEDPLSIVERILAEVASRLRLDSSRHVQP